MFSNRQDSFRFLWLHKEMRDRLHFIGQWIPVRLRLVDAIYQMDWNLKSLDRRDLKAAQNGRYSSSLSPLTVHTSYGRKKVFQVVIDSCPRSPPRQVHILRAALRILVGNS
jgi:hypothetical protein